jgi:HSP20 family protein
MDLQSDLDRMFVPAFAASSDDEWNEGLVFRPACEIEETDSHYVMSVDLPGIARKVISIEAKDNRLFLSGERKPARKSNSASERCYGKFHRVFTLPQGIEADRIEAQYQDGVLTIALPKSEAAKPRQIKITDGKGSFFGKLLGKSDAPEKQERTLSAVAAN